jgi:hypothetical protein
MLFSFKEMFKQPKIPLTQTRSVYESQTDLGGSPVQPCRLSIAAWPEFKEGKIVVKIATELSRRLRLYSQFHSPKPSRTLGLGEIHETDPNNCGNVLKANVEHQWMSSAYWVVRGAGVEPIAAWMGLGLRRTASRS